MRYVDRRKGELDRRQPSLSPSSSADLILARLVAKARRNRPKRHINTRPPVADYGEDRVPSLLKLWLCGLARSAGKLAT